MTEYKTALDELIKQGLKVGSKVKVVKRVDECEGWYSSWSDRMDIFIDTVLEVSEINEFGICLNNWKYPPTALKLVKDKTQKKDELTELREENKKLRSIIEDLSSDKNLSLDKRIELLTFLKEK